MEGAPQPVTFREALGFWLKLGFISFGGPAGQIAIMHQELVERRRWISERRFLHALNYCMVLPGPEAQQLATYIGWLMHGARGGIVAGGLFVLPSLLILIALSWVYMALGALPAVAGMLWGVKPAVTAIVAQAAWRVGSRALKNGVLWTIAGAAFLALFALKAPFPAVILGAGLIGWIGGRVAPDRFKAGGGHGAAKASHGPALIDDDTPTPAHARFSAFKLARAVAIGIGLWTAAIMLPLLMLGDESPLTKMGLFFTQAALLTFGGAYAVLPYVYQGAVTRFGWLTGTQMIDGLALGETTPGPLIMVVAFVGFVGGWQTQAAGGPEMSGMLGAVVATWFTFLPSFLFIFAGAPLIEATHNEVRLTAPLTAIMAAVVGVILNLALFFAYHVLWPAGFGGTMDWPSLVIGIGAAVALFRYKQGVMSVIGVCAMLGLIKAFV